MRERARVRLVQASQSEELRSLFRQLSEIEGPQGPKFSRKVLLELTARVVGRAYEPALLELCHLVRAAMLADRHAPDDPGISGRTAGFEWLFWGVETARAGAFRTAFAGRSVVGAEASAGGSDTLRLGAGAVTLLYVDERFELRYGRMPGLAALMELLLSALGYRALVEVLDPLGAPNMKRSAVSDAARALARRFYAWLGDRLPAAQAQRKFHAMTAFLEEHCGPDFTEEDIDDEAVLRFWLARGVEEGSGQGAGDFRGYRTTFLAFVALARVLAAGGEIGRFERALPIGPDIEAGEIDPPADVTIDMSVAEEDPLTRLQEEPAIAVKALNRRELERLRLPVGESDAVRRLPRSWLRAECFGSVQNRLSQALRDGKPAAALATIVAAGPQTGYGAQIAALETADAHLLRVAKACLYVLHRMGQSGTNDGRDPVGIAVQEIDFKLLGEARKAFEGLNRAGFERSAPDNPQLAPAYRALAGLLPEISERLRGVLHVLGSQEAWQPVEEEDRGIFAEALGRLYGLRHDKTRETPEAVVRNLNGPALAANDGPGSEDGR